MDDKTKNMIIYSVMGIIITLFFISIVIGNTMMQDATKDKSKNGDVSAQAEKRTHDYKKQNSSAEENTKEPNTIQENHEQKEIITPDPDALKEPEGFYREHFTDEQIKQSKKAAKQFATNYYAFNGDDPMQHIKDARRFMTDKMYEKLSVNTPKPTAATYKKKIVSAEVYEPYEPSEDYFVWKVRIAGDVYNSKANKTKREIVEYTLKMKQTEKTFQVSNYMLNVLDH
ncbi:hypothetical protein [Lentibacillus cibarius]|uniref:Uncharacterized protein n=1 Tax=Lentibacillus cibarius TaxID=2583219 RepID=A0A5S3QG31_9BACI|nr:hypothetical protein [Lentibacillus cibarius]TMN20852.1 hypothetical protein FFL34_01040 [Lentibacillus cibarius]